MTDIENPIKLKADLQEAALVLQSMRHPILSQAVLQAIKLIDMQSKGVEIGALDIDGPGLSIANFPKPRGPYTVAVRSYPDIGGHVWWSKS